MSAQVMEVSEGIPVDGRRFETPQISLDNQQPRYVAFLGSLVERQAMIDKPWQKGGGISVANPCLRYVKNFIRKGRITPVLKDTHDYRPADLWKRASEGDVSYFQQVIPPGYVPPLTESGAPSKVGYMMGKPAFPGEQINQIVNGNANILNNVRRGIVELHSLKGQSYSPEDLGSGIVQDKVIWEIQRAIFPTYPVVPILIEDVGRLLDAARQHTMIRDVVDDFMSSWEQFREYANTTVKQTHVKMREIAGASNGYIPTYTAMDLVLLEQLGISRQDDEIRRNATPAGDPELREMFKAWMQVAIEEKEALKAPRIDENTMKAAPLVEYDGFPGYSGFSGYSGEILSNATPEGAEQMAVAMADTEPFNPVIKPEDLASEFVCGCGRKAASLAGLKAHERACEVANAKTGE